MKTFSTRQAAQKLGLTQPSLSRYIAAKKIPTPKTVRYGGFRVHVWSEVDIERVRALLPKIANGRKTRYSKLKKQVPKKKRPKP
jgi:predicted DNA-binding transcriptional regulator AlpA